MPLAALPAAPPSRERFLALYDTRYPAADRFAASARSVGVPSHAFHGDVTAVWETTLRKFWRDPTGELVGLTGLDGLFCLDLLARDAGHRLVFTEAIGGGVVPDLPTLLRRAVGQRRRQEILMLPNSTEPKLHSWVIRGPRAATTV